MDECKTLIGNEAATNRYHSFHCYGLKKNTLIALSLILLFCVYFWKFTIDIFITNDEFETEPEYSKPTKFLVWSPKCQIPDLDPFAPDGMKFFERGTYEACSNNDPLTRIKQNFETNTVWLELTSYAQSGQNLSCCCQNIIRPDVENRADEQFALEPCVFFNKTVELPLSYEFIFVSCTSGGVNVYNNTHAIARDRKSVRDRVDKFTSAFQQLNITKRPLSVLMIAIDSISRLNLMRAMPLTAKHLNDTGWFELQGYNKIDDNTFPNLMAMLVGVNSSMSSAQCDPTKKDLLDKCPFIWNYFHDVGYVTAYAEDEPELGTFNFGKVGFTKPPTDFYTRPYMIAAHEKLRLRIQNLLAICLGYNNSVDHLFQYALDFATVYKNDPYFGLFWSNSFSHNNLTDPSSMDEKIKSYILQLEHRHILNDSMVIFFSDHGIRFGGIRALVTGWYEERLPYMYISLPDWFKKEHPHFVKALQGNRNRLTSPYDLYMTLKHVLELSKRTIELPKSLSCPKCQSIFNDIPQDRTCEDAAITPHWCTCSLYKPDDIQSKVVQNAVQFVIKKINDDLANDHSSRNNCKILELNEISNVKKAEYNDVCGSFDVYVVAFTVNPSNGSFEATVKYIEVQKAFELKGSVSRLNMYDGQSNCIRVNSLKKYCYCNDLI